MRGLGIDRGAVGSDVARSWRQYLLRKLARAIVTGLGLNRPTPLTTEIVQCIDPIVNVGTKQGRLHFKCGHGRLLWRALTHYVEEPETIAWLERLTPADILWDIGANVGMYSIYASKVMGCRVYAFEPEAQNYALLIQNIVLNEVQEKCLATPIAVARNDGFGFLKVPYITKGGAYNQFLFSDQADVSTEIFVPDSLESRQVGKSALQLIYGSSLDSLVENPLFSKPTYLKLDVDGLEDMIIGSGEWVARCPGLKSILVELNKRSTRHMAVPVILEKHGFALVSERSNWESRTDKSMESEVPDTNMIFEKRSL